MSFSTNKRATQRTARRSHRRMRLNTTAEGVMLVPDWLRVVRNIPRSKVFAVVLSLLLVAALFAFFDTDLFYVFDFELAGTRYLTKAEVEKASGVAGYNIFFIDPRAVEGALAKLPEAKSVVVTTCLPNQMSVTIEERQPQIVWLRGTETYWLDASGVALRARANLAQLPTIRDLDQVSVKSGQRVQPAAVAAFWALRDAWADGPRAVEWSVERGLAFTDEHGWKVYLGDANNMAGKLAILRALAAQLVAQNARIRFIDLGRGDPYFQ